ncbi:MAG: DUF1858 domain-containing protein [Trueperaceae bacterium]|nr:DUF1858 domain-containing protein [Trueperaceae bacterium]
MAGPEARHERHGGLTAAGRKTLLEARVSRILDAHPDALDTLVRHGFTPLVQAPMRFALAHTVNLGQAIRLRGLGEPEVAALLGALAAMGLPALLAPGAGAVEEED